jgi:hypothetical protein
MGEDPKLAPSGAKLPGWLTGCWNRWLRLRDCVHALKPCRAAILLVLVGLAFLLLASQGEDVARALAERRTNDVISSQAFWFFAAVLAWSLSAWYWARTMLSLRLPGMEHDRRAHGVRIWTPRLLGFAAPLGVAAAFYKAAGGYTIDEHAEVRELLEFYGFWCAAGAVAFLVAVSARRSLARAAYRRVKLEFLNLPHAHEHARVALHVEQLGLLTRSILVGTILASALLFALMVFAVQNAAPALGSAAIVLFAAAGWIAVASALDYAGMRFHPPVFSALLVTAVTFSLWNDNHAVRTLPEAQPAQRQGLRKSLTEWIKRHKDAIRRGETVPFFVVDAEGGGIRAAYWTVTVLGEIQNRHPSFASHVFSLSGVSGGSLGASVFVALLNESRESAMPFDIKKTGQAILGEDFLSPAVAAILYPDLAQRFLPVAVPAFDRATTLEQSWERAWQKHVKGRNRMSEPFDRLWTGGSEWTPALLLNATWVETGKRIIASNMRVGAGRRREDFVDVEDANAFFAPRSISLSTAAHMSARFTYVSPAGSLEKGGRTYGRVVDGGYFENSGATTTLAILETIKQLQLEDKDNDRGWKQVEPYVIHISNEPIDPKYANDSLALAPDNPNIRPMDFLNEAIAPLFALLSTRNARGYYARETAAWAVTHPTYSNYLHFGLCRRSANVPLGWVLSRSTRERMDDQLVKGEPCGADGTDPVFDNPAKLTRIDALFPTLKPYEKGTAIPVIDRSPGKSTPSVRTGSR